MTFLEIKEVSDTGELRWGVRLFDDEGLPASRPSLPSPRETHYRPPRPSRTRDLTPPFSGTARAKRIDQPGSPKRLMTAGPSDSLW